jgi:hypothetical protein
MNNYRIKLDENNIIEVEANSVDEAIDIAKIQLSLDEFVGDIEVI